ncbi:deoxyhypusine hydroxylase [Senna tora]|uniref:deoxyhypusine monooxygenase n=1 Tax=Senna tora TaxID=362788 RepID=A0A834WCK8_9FABA|nr:deoxyhypusine hydroxylase [Senna tora]
MFKIDLKKGRKRKIIEKESLHCRFRIETNMYALRYNSAHTILNLSIYHNITEAEQRNSRCPLIQYEVKLCYGETKDKEKIKLTVNGLKSTRDSSNLLAHEAAFALEALGAIGSDSNIPLLKNSLNLDPAQEVRETCELALQRIEHLKDAGSCDELSASDVSPFKSVDPAAPATSCSSVDQLRKVLLDEEKGMYERYAALFALRNDGGIDAVTAIIDSLGSKSALLRHEVAYVLGQLQDKAASAALSNILRDVKEHPMVRHEAAEALGSIADDHSVALLEEFVADPEPLVSQSCQVALSMLEYEQSGKSFELPLFFSEWDSSSSCALLLWNELIKLQFLVVVPFINADT